MPIKGMTKRLEAWYLRKARKEHAKKGHLRIAEQGGGGSWTWPVVWPHPQDNTREGAWVQAWLWVPGPDATDEMKEKGAEFYRRPEGDE